MSRGIFVVASLTNLVALACVVNPWSEGWAAAGVVFFVLEAAFLLLVGLPVWIHHRRKGLPARDALAASLDSVLGFLAGWV